MDEIFNMFEGESDPVARGEMKNEVLERDFERQETVEATPVEAPVDFVMAPATYYKAGRRHQLIFEGACTHCAHCGQPLTDAVSVERGIGPICSKKGYAEDPKQSDEIQAMIDLAEFPALMNFVVDRYKPQGVRAMMNVLVKICSLNRRSPVHSACCDAIDSLGYAQLASTLRESIAVVEVSTLSASDSSLKVWVKKSEWNWNWTNDVRKIPGSFFSREHKGTIVPASQKQMLWDLIKKHYAGLCCKTANGTVKIPTL